MSLRKILAEEGMIKRASSSIELDCAPGTTRPGDLLPGILEGLPITLDAKHPDHMIFGEWTWYIPEDQEREYRKHVHIIKKRIESLYDAGLIRYGSF